MQPTNGRAPTLSSAWYGILSGLAVERDSKGQDWCEKKGVGARRRYLNSIVPPNVSPIDALRSDSLAEQREALSIFVATCRMCPVRQKCPFGRD